ncbi:MAG: FecR domain-containing protein, partial [Chloroflexi bacterium]|nr:FecR domain-containing protein [Chloroflexota bacterium]
LVESLVGTVIIEPPVGSGPIPLVKGSSRQVPPGTVIHVDETSEAVITFFDHSFLRLFSGGTVRLEQLSAPKFRAGRNPNTVHLNLLAGRVRIGTAMSLGAPLAFRVTTPYGQAFLDDDGSYAIEVSGGRADVAAYRGTARVIAEGAEVTLQERQRTEILSGQAPKPATGVARNLLANGELDAPLAEWRIFNDQGADGGDVDGRISFVTDEGHSAVRFVRMGAQGNHCETILEQVLN